MAPINIEQLRTCLMDYCGTAAFNNLPAAIIDVAEIECMNGEELCRKAEDLGIDLAQFVIVGKEDD